MEADRDKVADYLVVVVFEYARESGKGAAEAFFELEGSGAIALLEEEYDIEHTLPLSSTVEALRAYVERSRGRAA